MKAPTPPRNGERRAGETPAVPVTANDYGERRHG